jgi:hypothetical protein
MANVAPVVTVGMGDRAASFGFSVTNATGALRTGQNIAVHRIVELLDHFASAARHARERIFRNMHRHLRFCGDPAVKPVQERAATGKHNAVLHNIRHQFGRCFFERSAYLSNDCIDRTGNAFAQFDTGNLDRFWQTGQQITPAQNDADLFAPAGMRCRRQS